MRVTPAKCVRLDRSADAVVGSPRPSASAFRHATVSLLEARGSILLPSLRGLGGFSLPALSSSRPSLSLISEFFGADVTDN